MAYRNIVRGISWQCLPRNASKVATSLFPISRSIQPTALWIKSSLSWRSISATFTVSAKSPRRMKWKVARIAIRRSQRFADFANRCSGLRLLPNCYRSSSKDGTMSSMARQPDGSVVGETRQEIADMRTETALILGSRRRRIWRTRCSSSWGPWLQRRWPPSVMGDFAGAKCSSSQGSRTSSEPSPCDLCPEAL